MNNELQKFARRKIKQGLSQLSEEHNLLFKHMYSPYELEADINTVVDNMPEEKLDWAMQQVQRTFSKA